MSRSPHPRSLRQSALVVLGVSGLILLIPLVAMQFTREVDWKPGDFLAAALLLVAAGMSCVLAARLARGGVQRAAAVAAVVLVFALVWAELAVGVFS